MSAPAVERPTPAVSPAGAVLAAAADRVDSLPHTRMGRVDIHTALLAVAPTYELAQLGLDLLVEHLRETGADDRWLLGWTRRCGRDETAAYLRASAEQVPAVPSV